MDIYRYFVKYTYKVPRGTDKIVTVHVPVMTGGPLMTTFTVNCLAVATKTFLEPIHSSAPPFHGDVDMIVCVGVYVEIVNTPALVYGTTISYM